MSAFFHAYRRAYAGLPREVWLLAAVMFVSRCGTMFLPFLAIFLRAEQGYTPSQAGLMLAVYGIGSVIGAYAGGWMTNRLGAIRVIVNGLVLGAPAFIVLPFCESTTAIAGLLLYLSTVRESVRPALATATANFTPREKHSKAFALNRLAFNLGISVGAGVSGVLATFGYHVLFGFNAVVAVTAALLLLRIFGHRADERPANETEAVSVSIKSPWNDRTFLAFIALQLVAGLVFFQLIGALPMFWERECGINEQGIATIFLINTLLVVLLEMMVTDRLAGVAHLKMVALGVGLVALGFGGAVLQSFESPLLGGGLALACALTLVWTAGEMLAAPFSMAFVASRSAGKARSLYMGLNAASMSAANVVAPILGTSLYEQSPWMPWWCCLAMAAILPGGFLLLQRSMRDPHPEDTVAPRHPPAQVPADDAINIAS